MVENLNDLQIFVKRIKMEYGGRIAYRYLADDSIIDKTFAELAKDIYAVAFLKFINENLEYEYYVRKEKMKEEQLAIKAKMREEALELKALATEREKLLREESKYKAEIEVVKEKLQNTIEQGTIILLQNRIKELEEQLANINDKKIQILNLQNGKAGYVYVISNLGSFGENVFKIGMTRRLEPEERIAELSGASVPFKFDIHAMIFSDDAPKLEAALHNHFADKKVNLVNGRKEFFNVTLEEIKQVVRDNHDKTVDFVNVPDAEQYRESLMIRKNSNVN